ncbi:unnamed protein product [Mytilus coruscus]|uniref:WAP domain-containing protein n=1 Tax=Mytilus coruscus TaxID=42192 RepID=A0A6J8EYN7_MYTCO|nr:unnamed protein product [Mytilus coruscus]
MIGCLLFHTRICNKEQIVSTMSRDFWYTIGQNISSEFDPFSCFGPGNEVVLPTIVPLNVTMMPCVHPDVVHYILNYDCYYYGLQKQMQGDSKLESCRFYWYSSACLYGTLQTNKDLQGQCSLEEVNGVLTKYEDELFKVSPDNVTMSECLGECYLLDSPENVTMSECLGECYLLDSPDDVTMSECLGECYLLDSPDNVTLSECLGECYLLDSPDDVTMSECLGECYLLDSPDDVTMSECLGECYLLDSPDDVTMSECLGECYLLDSPDNVTMSECLGECYLLDSPDDVTMSECLGECYLLDSPDDVTMSECLGECYLLDSPDDVTMSECLGLYNSADKCTRAMFSDDVFTIVQTCYGTAVSNRIAARYNIIDLSDYPCLVYQEMSECLYRSIKEYQLCTDLTEMEDHIIWLTNGLNDIMTIAMGNPLDERKTVETCIANVTKTPDFGQDLCDHGAGLIMSETTCLFSIGNPVCNSLKSAYIPCLTSGLSRKNIFCSAERIWHSLSAVSDLFGKLTQGRVDISSCNRDTGNKQGTCPAIGNHTVGTCVEECSGDYNCTGNQKCCSNGCGHVCMDPSDSNIPSYEFEITIKFDIPWEAEYTDKTSVKYQNLTREILKQMTIASGNFSSYIDYMKIKELRQGSVYVVFEIKYYIQLTASDIISGTLGFVNAARMDPKSELDLIKAIDTDHIYVKIITGNSEVNKPGNCPTLMGVGICLQNCSSDSHCAGDQKCCSNGCGHVCMDPAPEEKSGKFNITIRFVLDWMPEYREENSTFKTTLSSELNRIIASSELKTYLMYIKVVTLRPGSIIAGCEAEFNMQITEQKLETTMKTRIEEIQFDPEYTILQKWSDLSVEILQGMPEENKPGNCPTSMGVGICLQNCSSDSHCTGDQKCCSNGCGHVCMDPVFDVTTPSTTTLGKYHLIVCKNLRLYPYYIPLPRLNPYCLPLPRLNPYYTPLPRLNPYYIPLPRLYPYYIPLPRLNLYYTPLPRLNPYYIPLPRLNLYYIPIPRLNPYYIPLPRLYPYYTPLPRLYPYYIPLPRLYPYYIPLPRLYPYYTPLPRLYPYYTPLPRLYPYYIPLPRLNPYYTPLPRLYPYYTPLPRLNPYYTPLPRLYPYYTPLPRLNPYYTPLPRLYPYYTPLPRLYPYYTPLPRLYPYYTPLPRLNPYYIPLPRLYPYYIPLPRLYPYYIPLPRLYPYYIPLPRLYPYYTPLPRLYPYYIPIPRLNLYKTPLPRLNLY